MPARRAWFSKAEVYSLGLLVSPIKLIHLLLLQDRVLPMVVILLESNMRQSFLRVRSQQIACNRALHAILCN